MIRQRQHLSYDQLATRIEELLTAHPTCSDQLYEWTVSRDWIRDDAF